MVSRGQVPRVLAVASPFTSASSGSHALPAHSCTSSPAGRQKENPPPDEAVESNSAFFQRQRELLADAQDQSSGRALQQRSQSRAGWEAGLAPRRQGGRGAEGHTPQERRSTPGAASCLQINSITALPRSRATEPGAANISTRKP